MKILWRSAALLLWFWMLIFVIGGVTVIFRSTFNLVACLTILATSAIVILLWHTGVFFWRKGGSFSTPVKIQTPANRSAKENSAMKQIILLFGIFLVGSYFMYGLITVISKLKSYRMIDLLIVMTVLLFIFFLELFLIKEITKGIRKKFNIKIPLKFKWKLPLKFHIKSTYKKLTIPRIKKTLVPDETEIQLQKNLTILQQSVDLMKSTKNIETFINQYAVASNTAFQIEQVKTPDITIKQKFLSGKEVHELAGKLLPTVLNDSYLRMKMDALQFKTKTERREKFEEYLKLLQKRKDDLYLANNYELVISKVEDDISGFKEE